MDLAEIVRPELYANEERLHALLGHMRQHEPVAWIETETHRPFFAVTRHADILEVARRSDVFANAPRPILSSRAQELESRSRQAHVRTLIAVDGAEHKDLRALTKDWFMPQSLNRFEARIREIAIDSVETALERGPEIDFVADVAIHYPLRVIMEILGVPSDQEEMMLKITQVVFGASDPDIALNLTSEQRMGIFMQFVSYCEQVTAARREAPRDDLASVIANAELEGSPLTSVDLMGYFLIVATAGHDTTSSSTAGALHALLENPDQMALVRENPDALPGLVEESIRWVTPVKHFMRTATSDCEVGGRLIPQGEAVMLLYPSGNRDDSAFDNPFQFDATRRPNRHLSFGHGAHHCLGNLLAKMEMRIFYEEFFKRVGRIELIGEPKLIQSVFVSGLKALPVRIEAK
ncbi:MAG: cytochrome P450 [Gammaproteobacteria bacterium]|nr:cytochrome P450 [Gammaproteobacteria bacterium]MYK81708.1 cytochrome P450 [Gammaproteobacteria bacterium]